jgi:hypothetical protein
MIDNVMQYVKRWIGWDDNETVAMAMKSIGMCLARQTHLAIFGTGDMVPFAAGIHRRAMPIRPFIVVDNRRGDRSGNLRSTASRATLAGALRDVDGGTICIRRFRMPPDWETHYDRLISTDACLMFVHQPIERKRVELIRPGPIVVPDLATRSQDDIRHIIDDVEAETRESIGIDLMLPESHRAWIATNGITPLADRHATVHDIETAVIRLMASLTAKTESSAAGMIGCAPVVLHRWLRRHGFTWPPITPPPLIKQPG